MTKVIVLGSRVKDRITTLEVTAISRIEYLNGCVRYEVQPSGLHEGKTIDSSFIDVDQLDVLEEPKDQAEAHEKPPGGPGKVPAPPSVP